MAQRQEVVENIFLSFKHIPLIMENAEETLKIFYEDKKLGDYVWRLYDALLTGVPLLVGILLHRSDEKGQFLPCNSVQRRRRKYRTYQARVRVEKGPSQYPFTARRQHQGDLVND